MTVSDLPALNAILNSCATVFIVMALVAIKMKEPRWHAGLMACALGVSAAFLASYLVYHYHVGHVRFAGQGTVRVVYFTILITHLILAIANLPLLVMTVLPALRQRYDKHRRLAKWAAPIWLYVSVTGVVIYLMCYKWYGPPLN